MGEMITAREAMARAIDRAEHGDIELGQLWLAIARELRKGSWPKRFAPGGIVGPGLVGLMPGEKLVDRFGSVPTPGRRLLDEPSVAKRPDRLTVLPDGPELAIGESAEDAIYGYQRGQKRPPSLSAYRAAVDMRKALDSGDETAFDGLLHIDRPAASSLINEIIMRCPEGWESLPEDDPLRSMDDFRQRVVFGAGAAHRGDAEVAYAAFGDRIGIVAGQIETDAQREQRFATAPPQRPYVDPARWRDVKPYVDPLDSVREAMDRDERTRVLDAGDPTHCRHCGVGIYEVNPSDVGTRHRYRHDGTGQAICPVAPRGTDGNGDESYVTGTHTFAEPGGLPYRAE